MSRIKYSEGEKVGCLIFIRDSEPHISPTRASRTAIFRCKCGKEFKAIIRSAVTGNTKSCGCFKSKSTSSRFKKHGKRNHPLYGVWQTLKSRCYNKNRLDYKYYGGRGIVLSDEFVNDFGAWFDYVTSLPLYEKRAELKLTIDRIDNNGIYERGNMRWATRLQQVQNRGKKD